MYACNEGRSSASQHASEKGLVLQHALKMTFRKILFRDFSQMPSKPEGLKDAASIITLGAFVQPAKQMISSFACLQEKGNAQMTSILASS